jgi:dihydrolipoamide dehydrogenase
MKAIPRRLLVLGGGPAGVDLAQAVRRLGGEVALVEAAERVLDREPAPLGEVLRRDGVELVLGVRGAPPIPVTQARTLPSSCSFTPCTVTHRRFR